VWLKTAAALGKVAVAALDDSPNDTDQALEQAMDQAAKAGEAKQRHDQLCEQAAKLSASK
jgi:hypothetical protein